MKFPARMPRRSKTLRVCSEVVALGGRVRRHVGPSRRLRPLKASGSRWRAPLARAPSPGWQVAKREVEPEGKSDELVHQRKIVVAVDLLPW
jgi:hypothetical protein